MAETTLKFVFQDDSPGGGGATEPARPQSPAGGPDPVAGEATRQAGGRSRSTASPSPSEPAGAARSTSQAVGDALVNALGRQLERLPFFGQALRLLTEIATASRAFEAFKTGGGFLRELLSRTFAETAARTTAAAATAAGQASAAGGRTIVESAQAAAESFVRGFNKTRRDVEPAGRLPASRPPLLPSPGDDGDDDRLTVPRFPGLRGEALSREIIVRPAGGATAAGNAQGALTVAGGARGAAGGLAAAGGGAGALAAPGAAGAAGGGAAGAAAGAAALLGPVGVAILAGVAVVGAAVVAIRGLIAANDALRKHIAEVAERLRPFSAEIQAASARIEVAQLRQDIEQANANGGRVARFQEAQSRLDRGLSRIAAAVEGPLLDAVTPLVEHVAGVVEVGGKIFAGVTEVLNALGFFKPTFIRLLEVQNRLLGFAQDEANELPPEADILGAFNSLPDLTVNFNGRIFSGNGEANFGKLEFRQALPNVGLR